MLKKIMRPLHPSWCFYAAVWGVIIGLVFGVVVGQTFFSETWLLILLGVVLLACWKYACRITMIVAFLIGILIGNFRISAQLVGREVLAELQGQNVLIIAQLSDDPDSSKGTMVAKLKDLQIHGMQDVPVENYNKLVENFSLDVEKSESSVEKSKENVENSDGDNTDRIGSSNISLREAAVQAGFTKVAGTMYVTITSKAELERSDLVLLEGKLSDGFGTYVGKIYRAKLLTAERAGAGDIFAKLKHGFKERVSEYITSPEVDLGMGYLMGMKSGLPEDFAEALQIVGMTHVVVASGAHLSILIDAAKKIFGRISKFSGMMFALLMIMVFVLIVGFTPSMMRAALVSGLSLVMGYVGRRFTPMRLIAFVAMITLLLDPTFLINLGWQLSFASFFGILVMAPHLTRTLYGGKKPPWLASMLITSVATSLVCAPILIYNFGSLSFLALIANLIILPTLPYAMLLMLLTGVTSFWPLLASLVALPTTWLLDLHIWVVNFLSEQTTFVINPPAADARIYLLYLPVLLILILPKIWQKHTKRKVYQAEMSLIE